MRLEKYLNEKFYNSFNLYGHTIEIFENPSKSELNSITDGGGYKSIRFFANMKTKKVIMWSGEIPHGTAVDDGGVMPTPGFDYWDYVFKGRNADIIFGGTLENGNVISDSWDTDGRFPNPDLTKKADTITLDNVKKMADQNLTWLKKYMDIKQVEKIIGGLLERLEEMEADGDL